MGQIQKTIRDDRGEIIELDHNDARYWEGPAKYVPFPKLMFRQSQPGQPDDKLDHLVVKSEDEMIRAGSAWKESPDEARAYFTSLESDMAKAAATANYEDRNLSEPAKRERLAHERATDEMVTDVPAPKRRGRPAKAKTEAV